MSQEEVIFKNLVKRENENVVNDYLNPTKQNLINKKMRKILINWIIELIKGCRRENPLEVLFLTVMVIDKFLYNQSKPVLRRNFQLVGIMALRIALKFENGINWRIGKCVYNCDNMYTKEECLNMESDILNTINYNVYLPTSHTFLVMYLDADTSCASIKQLSLFLLSKILSEYEIVMKYKPSIIASASIYFSKQYLTTAPYWSPALKKLSGYKIKDFSECLASVKHLEIIKNFKMKINLVDVDDDEIF